MSQREESNVPLQNLNNNLFTLISAACTVEENDFSNEGSIPLSPMNPNTQSEQTDDYDASDDEEPLSKMCNAAKAGKAAEEAGESKPTEEPAPKEGDEKKADKR